MATQKIISRSIDPPHGPRRIDLCTQSFGDSKDTCILLMAGAGAVYDFWPQDFCSDLGTFVIRYDHRDYGYSTHFPVTGKAPYSLLDMVEDAIAILDGYGVHKAHIIGHSMGGYLAELIGIYYPQYALSLTVMSAGTGSPNLPAPDPEFMNFLFSNKPSGNLERDAPGWLKSFKALNGSYDFDEKMALAYLEAIYEHDPNADVAVNQILALSNMEDLTDKLQKVNCPTLVIHGMEDRLQPLVYGQAIAKAIPNSKLVSLSKAGHMFFHQSLWQQILSCIQEHVRS